MPPNTVYVGRPAKWGNPIIALTPDRKLNHQKSVEFFCQYIETKQDYSEKARAELRGKNLACWCPLDKPCHADVLLEIANCD